MPGIERIPLEYSGIFYDSANIKEFKLWFETRILGGATTNPVLFQKEGVLDVAGHIRKMVDIAGEGFPISIEIPDTELSISEMLDIAKRYRDMFPKNAIIKVPMDPKDPQKGFEVMYKLAKEGIRVNATLGISMGQLIGASEALRLTKAKGDNYISLFWGRREEAKKQMVDALSKKLSEKERQEIVANIPDAAATLVMTLNYLQNHSLASRVIVGSIRSTSQIERAFNLGADIVAIPPKLLKEWMYTQRGEETVEEFNKAYRDVRDKLKLF